MAQDKSKFKPTGTAVNDVKGQPEAPTAKPESNQIQIHAGNVSVLTVRMLDEINKSLNRIAKALENINGRPE